MKILVTGATGYIGGSIATKLLAQGHEVVGLARSDDAAASLRKRGIEPLMASLTDYGPLQQAARSVDAVINAANSDNAFVVLAILPQLYGTGKVFIQTSGTSVVSTYDQGEFVDRVFYEDTPFQPQPEKATRVAIDLQVLRSALDGVRSVVIRPGLIYGGGIGVSSGSVQIPKLIEEAQKGVARHIGRGLNVWSNVHIDDVSDLFLLALEHSAPGSLYYAENGESSMKAAVESISRMLGQGGKTQDWPIADAAAVLGQGAHLTWGSNSRVRATKARRTLGWDPKGPTLAHEIEHGFYKEKYGR